LHLKVFAATAPCDLRANFNGLWVVAQERLGEDSKGIHESTFSKVAQNGLNMRHHL
jgi:hypothetical protein